MKPKRPLRWSRLADIDLQSAHAYLEERNPSAARRFATEILQSLEHIRSHPEGGAVAKDLVPEGRYRHWVCGRYRIIYRIGTEWLWILRIWDARRNPEDLIPE